MNCLVSAALRGIFKTSLGKTVTISASDKDPAIAHLLPKSVQTKTVSQVIKQAERVQKNTVPVLLYFWPQPSFNQDLNLAMRSLVKKGAMMIVVGDAFGTTYTPSSPLPKHVNCYTYFHKGICHLIGPMSNRFSGTQLRVFTTLDQETVSSFIPEGLLLENPYRVFNTSLVKLPQLNKETPKQLDASILSGICDQTLPGLDLDVFERLMNTYMNETRANILYVSFLSPIDYIRFGLKDINHEYATLFPGQFHVVSQFIPSEFLISPADKAVLIRWLEAIKAKIRISYPELEF